MYIRPRLNISVPLVSAARMLRCDLRSASAHALISASSRAALRRSRAVSALVLIVAV
jgi:hypothetical protein